MRLDFGVIAEHLEDVVHSLAYHEALIDISRLLKRRAIRTAIVEHYGEPAWALIEGQLEDVAIGEREQLYVIDRLADKVRRNGQVVGLGLNMITPLIQLTGLTTIAARFGYMPTVRAIGTIYASSSPYANVLALQAESVFLAHRAVSSRRRCSRRRSAPACGRTPSTASPSARRARFCGGRIRRSSAATSWRSRRCRWSSTRSPT